MNTKKKYNKESKIALFWARKARVTVGIKNNEI